MERENATNNFATVVKKGGFETVYKGTYHHLPIAVKVLNMVHQTVGIMLLET